MSGISSAELLLLLVIGLIVLGPKRLPEIANKIGGWLGQARRMTRVMKRQLEDELNMNELNQIGQPKTAHKRDAVAAPDSTENDEDVAEHIPNDDDSFSPLHEEGTE